MSRLFKKTFGKLFTKVINNRLTNWAENYNLYTEAQAGFRVHMSTVITLHGLINNLKYSFFANYTKAFDFIVRDIIWYKLLKL